MNSARALPAEITPITVKILEGPHKGESFVISKDSFSIGRGPDNDIILVNDPKLSRNHIKVIYGDFTLQIENLSARNPIFYKNNFETKIDLKPNESLKIGSSEMEFSWVSNKTVVHQETQVKESPPIDSKLDVSKQAVSYKNSSGQIIKENIPQVLYPALNVENSTSLNANVANPSTIQPYNSNSKNANKKRSGRGNQKLELKLLIIGGVAILLIVLIFSSSGEKKVRKPTPLKDTSQINSELLKSSDKIQQHKQEKHLLEDGRFDRIYESAQSYYIKGFRDYRNGQYLRAIQAFQAALSFDPNHVLARKYLHQSIKKQDELMQFNLDQAKRYRDKNNYRLCRASAQQVMVMSPQKGSTESRYTDAKKIFDECDTLSRGRY